MIPVIHASDIHYSKTTQESVLQSLKTLYEYGKAKQIKLWVLSGDLFDKAIYNTESSGLPELICIIQKMLYIAPIVTVYGTPTHDLKGCYDIFTRISAPFNFMIIEPDRSYFLGEHVSAQYSENSCLLILGCPEPGKEWFLADKSGLSAAESNDLVCGELKKLFFGLAAIRQNYAKLPAIFIFHGNVIGASYENGRIVEAGNDISIGSDDLSIIGADYNALGHIHIAQQVKNLNAYYAGSSHPLDWGERDQKGFFYLEIDEQKKGKSYPVKVARIDYPHAPRKKITIGYNEQLPETVSAYKVWLEIKGNKEELKNANPDKILEQLIGKGALAGSRVTTLLIPTETVRAESILKAKGLKDKIGIYAEHSNKKIGGSIPEKAAVLEKECRDNGAVAGGCQIRVNKLKLRGAKGIYKRQKVKEIEIDLTRYDQGLIALIGKNGTGKTTLIENMHPYPHYITRYGKLQDHFFLKDSYRDLYFTDTLSGSEYRAYIQIDGQGKGGKAEYFLYKMGECGYVPITNGRKEDYVNAINKLFGSFALFLKTAFISQKPNKDNPDLPDATPGVRKAIFRELAGLDYLQVYSDSAKQRADAIEREILQLDGQIEGWQKAILQMPESITRLTQLETSYKEKHKALESLKEKGCGITLEVKGLQDRLTASRQVTEKLITLDKQLNELYSGQAELKERICELKGIMKKADKIEGEIAEYNKLKKREAELVGLANNIIAEQTRIKEEYQKQEQVCNEAKRGFEEEIHNLKLRLVSVSGEKGKRLIQLGHLKEKLEERLSCPQCGHQFCRHQEELEKQLSLVNIRIKKNEEEIKRLNAKISGLNKKIGQIVYPIPPEYPVFNDEELTEIRETMDFINIDRLHAMQSKAGEANIRIQEANGRLKELNTKIVVILAEKQELAEKADGNIEDQYHKAAAALEQIREEYKKCKDVVSELNGEIKYLTKHINEMQEWETGIKELSAARLVKEKDGNEWSYLAKACGKDGIQALELDALSPDIAFKANTLLESAYGTRFQIEFRTTRIGGRGADTHQIEDFLIMIHDAEDGSEQEISTLSGGEEVWIKRAINDAFAIIRAEHTGLKFLTVFQDETDGALDADAKIAYYRMLEAAHSQSGRYHTIVITHSPQVQEMIKEKIDITEISVQAKEEAA